LDRRRYLGQYCNVIASWISPKAAKGIESDIAGRGLIAIEPIEKDEVVAVKGGHIVTTAQLQSLPLVLQNSDIQIADDLHLVALTDEEYESVMLFLNHSCEPNVGFGGNSVLIAMRDIEAEEELTTDYALFDDFDGSMECHCGRLMCRGSIHGRDWQRHDLQMRYRGYFSWYLERKIRGAPSS
jgi:uncharacterized protein